MKKQTRIFLILLLLTAVCTVRIYSLCGWSGADTESGSVFVFREVPSLYE